MSRYSLVTRRVPVGKKRKGKPKTTKERITAMRINLGRRTIVKKIMELAPSEIAEWALESEMQGRQAIGRFNVERFKKGVIISPNFRLNPQQWPEMLTVVVWPELKDAQTFFLCASGTKDGGPASYNRGAVLTLGVDFGLRQLELNTIQYHYVLEGKFALPKELHKKYAGVRRDAVRHLLSLARELKMPLLVRNQVFRYQLDFLKAIQNPKLIGKEKTKLKQEIINICKKHRSIGGQVKETSEGAEVTFPGLTQPKVRIDKQLLR